MYRRSPAPNLEPSTESYLESLSDLLIGVLFIFMIILMSFSLNLKVAQVEQRLAERRLSDGAQLRKDLLTTMSRRMSKRGVSVDIDERNGILRLRESLLFPRGSAAFTSDGLKKVAIIAHQLAAELPCYSNGGHPGRCPDDAHPMLDAVFIEGHTDTIPITGGPFKDNWALSAARSQETYRALTESAPELKNIRNISGQLLLSISAYGDTRPVTGYGSPQENEKRSRRIDLRFIVATPNLEKP